MTPRKGDYLLSGIFVSKGPKSEVAHHIRNNGEVSGLVFIAKDKTKHSLCPKSPYNGESRQMSVDEVNWRADVQMRSIVVGFERPNSCQT